jgi:hypothetical protein
MVEALLGETVKHLIKDLLNVSQARHLSAQASSITRGS